jgi:hypothetical protein
LEYARLLDWHSHTADGLLVDPADGLVDDLSRIAVTGAPEGRPVEFKLSVTDAAGHRWRSRDGEAGARLFWNMSSQARRRLRRPSSLRPTWSSIAWRRAAATRAPPLA